MDKQIEQVIRRTKSYMYVDGTYELKLGATGVLYSIFLFLQGNPFHWKLNGYVMFLVWLVLIGGGLWLIDRIIRFIKERYTYRRSGYVSQPWKRNRSFRQIRWPSWPSWDSWR